MLALGLVSLLTDVSAEMITSVVGCFSPAVIGQ